MAEELEMGTEQLAEMAANAEATMGADANLSQNLSVEDALDLGSAEIKAESEASAPSFNINNIVSGGPGDGGFGQPSAPSKPNLSTESTPQPSDFMKAMDQVIDSNANEIFVERFQPKTLSEKINPIVGPKTRYAGQDIDMFRYQDDFDPQGFNYFNPEKQKGYIEAETWGSALSKGFDSFATRFGNTFTDYFASYGRMGEALLNADWDLLKYTESEMIDANFEEYKESMKNYTFVPPEEEDDIFSKRSVSEFIGNAGFALGTFAGLGLELVADAVLTAVTAGGGSVSFGATAARVGAKEAVVSGAKAGIKSGLKQGAKTAAFRFTDFVADIGQGAYHFANQSTDALSAAGKVTQKSNQAKAVSNAGKIGSDALRSQMKEVFDIYTLNMRNIIKSKSFGQLATNIAKGAPLLGTGIRYGEKIAAGAKGGLSTGKLIGIGLQGVRRMAQEFNMSSTEANFEAVTSYGSTLNMMVEQYRADNQGENPSATEFAKMENLAMKSASSNYNTNLGILMVTNRFQFGTLFNRFAGANKWTKEILKEGAENTLGVNRMWKSSKLVGKTYEKGFFGTYGLAGKIAKDFGRKQALYEVGKTFAKDMLRFEVTEGLQENIQEMSGAAWKYYYAGQYNGTKYTLGQAFNKGLDEQFTKQGLRTFLQGALTGSLIRPVTHTISKTTNYLNEKATERAYKDNPAENPYVKMREQLKKDIVTQNDLMAQMSNKKYEDTIVNFTTQVDSSLAQTEAAAKGSQYEWQNAKDNSVLGGAMAANRSGTISTYQQAIREMGKTMSNEEFEAAFGIKLSDTKYNSAAEMTDAMAKDVKKYSDTVDGIRKKIQNLPDPLMYEKGSKEQIASIIMHNAQEDAIRIVALNAMKASRASERAQAITQDLLTIPGFSNSSEYALRVLANPENFKAESGNMLADIKLLEESLQATELAPEQKQQVEQKIKDKKRVLELYDKWMGFWGNRDTIAVREDAKTGEEVEQKEKLYDTLTGVPFKVQEYDEDGNLINDDLTVYSLDHKDMVETFREFINLRNKEYGINDQLSEESLRDAFDKVVDYVRLDQDAKDYMSAMDLLYNPEYYRQTILNLQDGRFKYELLEFVDSLNDRLRNVILSVAMNSDLEDQLEKLQLAAKLYEELSNAVASSDYYKNLVLISIEENTGLQNAKFAQENVKKLNELIEDKIAEMLDAYATQDVTGDINDLQYEEFLKTKKVPRYVMSLIARRIAQEIQLSDRQSEVYEANKDEIDGIIATLKFDENANGGVQDGSKVSLAKEALVQTGEFEMAQLDAMEDNDVLSLALERNLISEDDVVENFSGKSIEVISDEVYDRFKQNQEVDDAILESIARRDLEGIDLTERELEIMTAKAAEISDIQSIIEDERVRAEEEDAPNQEPEKEDVPQVLEQEEDVQEKTTDPLAGSVSNAEAAAQATEELLERLQGTGKDGTNKTENEQEPFVVEGDPEDGFDVVSRNGITLTDEKIESEEKAIEFANELNNSRADIDWTRLHLGDLSSFEDPTYKVDQMVRRGQMSLRAYNKANETTIQTLEDYYKIPEGKRNLDDIKESVLTGVPLNKIKQKRKKAVRAEQEQLDLFEDTTSGFVGGPALPLQSVQDLFDRLEEVTSATTSTTATVSDIEAKKAERIKRYFNRPANRMQKFNPDGENTDLTEEQIDEVEQYIEAAKEAGWNVDRTFIQLSKLGYTYAIGNSIEAFKNYLTDRLSGETNIKVTSEFNINKEIDVELDALEQPASTDKAKKVEKPVINIYWGSSESFTNTKVLSNLAPRKFTYQGKDYGSVEHAYQTLKSGSFDQITYDKYVKAGGYGTKIRGKAVQKGFDNLQLMRDLVVESFKQNPEQAKLLLNYSDFTHTTNEVIDKAFLEGIRLAQKNAELDAFNKVSQQMSEKIGKFVSEGEVSEETILDQLRKINSCFK